MTVALSNCTRVSKLKLCTPFLRDVWFRGGCHRATQARVWLSMCAALHAMMMRLTLLLLLLLLLMLLQCAA